MLVKTLDSVSSYASPLLKVSDFNSATVKIVTSYNVYGISYMRFYNEANLQFILVVESQYGELLICGTSYWKILKSPHEPTVRCNILPATQTAEFGYIQCNEADSSNRSTVPPAIFPLSSLMNQHHPLQLYRQLQQVQE